jgi:general stress protein YciG
MSGTKEGGEKAAVRNKEKYGEDFYSVIGADGGSAPYTGKKGFAANIERARSAGKLGGSISRRTKKDLNG